MGMRGLRVEQRIVVATASWPRYLGQYLLVEDKAAPRTSRGIPHYGEAILSQAFGVAMLAHPSHHCVALLLLCWKVRLRRWSVLWEHYGEASFFTDFANYTVIGINTATRQLGFTARFDTFLPSNNASTAMEKKYNRQYSVFGNVCWLEHKCFNSILERDYETFARHASIGRMRLQLLEKGAELFNRKGSKGWCFSEFVGKGLVKDIEIRGWSSHDYVTLTIVWTIDRHKPTYTGPSSDVANPAEIFG
jgi:hypothetical protein